MPHRLRKVRKLRGSRSHGWGVRQHKGKGSHGGHGRAGGDGTKMSYTIKYEPNRYGKHGFHSVMGISVNTVNVGEINELAGKLSMENHILSENEQEVIDLDSLGFDKLLGSGTVNRPLNVKVKSYSQLALKKVEDAKGHITKIE